VHHVPELENYSELLLLLLRLLLLPLTCRVDNRYNITNDNNRFALHRLGRHQEAVKVVDELASVSPQQGDVMPSCSLDEMLPEGFRQGWLLDEFGQVAKTGLAALQGCWVSAGGG